MLNTIFAVKIIGIQLSTLKQCIPKSNEQDLQ